MLDLQSVLNEQCDWVVVVLCTSTVDRFVLAAMSAQDPLVPKPQSTSPAPAFQSCGYINVEAIFCISIVP